MIKELEAGHYVLDTTTGEFIRKEEYEAIQPVSKNESSDAKNKTQSQQTALGDNNAIIK